MKFYYLLVIIFALAFSPQSRAESWFDSFKSMLGMEAEAETPALPNITDMIFSVSKSVGIDKSQAEGSLASIFNYAKFDYIELLGNYLLKKCCVEQGKIKRKI